MIGRKEKNGPNGSGFNQDTSFTLNTVDRHAVAYGIDRAAYKKAQDADIAEIRKGNYNFKGIRG